MVLIFLFCLWVSEHMNITARGGEGSSLFCSQRRAVCTRWRSGVAYHPCLKRIDLVGGRKTMVSHVEQWIKLAPGTTSMAIKQFSSNKLEL